MGTRSGSSADAATAAPVRLGTHRSRRTLLLARITSDAASLAAALGLASLARFGWGWLSFTEDPDLGWMPYTVAGIIWVVTMIWALAVRSLYDEDTLVPGGGEFSRVLRALPEAVAVLVFVAFLVRGEQLSRSWFLLSAVFSAALLLGERLVFRRALERLRAKGRLRRPVVLVTRSGEDPGEIPRRLGEFDVVASATAEDLLEHRVDATETFLLDSRGWQRDLLWETVLAAGQESASVYVLSGLGTVSADRVTTRHLGEETVMRITPPRISGYRGMQKRALDLVAVAVLAIPVLLVGAVVSIIQLITSGLPIFYRQERLGLDGEKFRMWKFRSMRVDAESETGAVWAERDDPRRTKFGTFLRRSSLDELPQFWNVLRGDMSMVGPRPERPEFVEQFSEDMRWYRYRLRTKPGLTGMAQAAGLRGQTPLEDRVEQDNWYIENWSLVLDIQIMLRTVGAVIKGTNAE